MLKYFITILLGVLPMSPIYSSSLQNEIFEMGANDQAMRQKVVDVMNGDLQTKIPIEIENSVVEID